MKTLPILLALATTFGATIGLPYSPLWHQVQVRERRDTNFVDTSDEKFNEDFRGYDKDGDGRVTAAEIREFHLAQGAGERESDEALSHMWSFDHDRDGGLSAEEFCHWFHSPFPFHAFQGYDANSDRKFSAEEIQEFHEESGVSESETKEMVSKMRSFDKDENGVLGEQEFRSLISSTRKTEENAMAATFRSYDRNGDGKVSGAEIRMIYEDAGPCGRIFGLGQDNLEARKAIFRLHAFDEDGDGELNEGEFGSWFSGDGRFDLAWRKSLFDAIDADGSGAMSREEYRAALDLWDFTADVAERIVEEYFSKYDLDGDKSINLAEFHSWTSSGRTKEEMRERFRFADKDGNDRISEDELRADYSKIGAHEIAGFSDIMLKVADSDGDGAIDFDEYNKGFNGAGSDDKRG